MDKLVRGLGRSRLDARFGKIPGVRATGIGLKLVAGRPTDTVAFVVYVARKQPLGKLPARARIPKRVTLGGRRWPTDVVPLGRLVAQSLPPLARRGFGISDHVSSATLGALARRGEQLFGLSCAHAIWGRDLSVLDQDPIDLWVPEMRAWRPFGTAALAVREAGRGSIEDYGLLDAGLVATDDPWMRDYAADATPLAVRPAPSSGLEALSLVGTPVRGKGVAMGERRGVIHAVLVNDVVGSGFRADTMIVDPEGDGLTFPGDSGLIWFAPDGAALALHTHGDAQPFGLPSKITVATFVARVQARLGVELLG